MVEESHYRVGVAAFVITPTEPMWGAGYAHRNRPIAEKAGDLWAKALVLEDQSGARLVIVTTDLLGLPRTLAEPVACAIGRRFNLGREQILLTSSHTHSGPVLRDSLVDIYPMRDGGWAAAERYSAWLQGKLVELVAEAMGDRSPARLSYGLGEAGFGVNRREPTADQGIIIGCHADGPVDHDVPVLRVTASDGTLRAVLFGYACHGTTLDFHQWCGDYPGFAQADLEASHPGARAMFVAGCGADINPMPRRRMESCRRHGRSLAEAVQRVLASKMRPITGPLASGFKRVDLPFDHVPARAELERRCDEGEPFERTCASRLLRRVDAGHSLPASYACPIQVVRLGDDLTLVALGGEAVVDYAHRIKRELAQEGTWVIAYAHEVFAYIPSRRVLAEGGYEADASMAVYGLPARWTPQVEEIIIAGVRDLNRELAKGG